MKLNKNDDKIILQVIIMKNKPMRKHHQKTDTKKASDYTQRDSAKKQF
jgi:hypothetical protein